MNKTQSLILIVLISCFLYSTNIVFSQTSNNQTSNNNDNVDSIPNLLLLIGTVITAVVSLFVGLRQYLEEIRNQRLEYKNRLEFEYDIDLRKKRIIAYESLWELTKIDFDEMSLNSQIKLKRNSVNKWYYENGHGMLLTESTQKLYSNYKEALEKIEKNWDVMIHCKRCSENENVRGECSETACSERRRKFCEIIFLKDMTSGFRTNLLKDIGTREELKKSSSYAELYIKWKNQEIYKNSVYPQNLEFTIFLLVHNP